MTKTIQLGGKERNLRFTIGTLKHIGRITGADPLGFGVGITENPGRLYDMVEVIIMASLTMEYERNNMNVDFTKDDVERWVSDMEMTEALGILGLYSEAFNAGGQQNPNG